MACRHVNGEVLPDYFQGGRVLDCVGEVAGWGLQGGGVEAGEVGGWQGTGSVSFGEDGGKGGGEEVGDAVGRVVRERVDCLEGEDVEEMVRRFAT